MLFTSRPSAIIYILRNEVVYYDRRGKSVRQTISAEAVDFLEVIDEARFAQLIDTFITAADIRRQRILLVLGDHVTFQAVTEPAGKEDIRLDAEDFSDRIPIDSGKQHIVAYEQRDSTLLFATNRELFLTLAEHLTAHGNKLTACVPASYFDIRDTPDLSREQRTYFFDKFHPDSSPDFLARK